MPDQACRSEAPDHVTSEIAEDSERQPGKQLGTCQRAAQLVKVQAPQREDHEQYADREAADGEPQPPGSWRSGQTGTLGALKSRHLRNGSLCPAC